MKKKQANNNADSQPQKEDRSYSVEELLKLGEEKNSMNFAKLKDENNKK